MRRGCLGLTKENRSRSFKELAWTGERWGVDLVCERTVCAHMNYDRFGPATVYIGCKYVINVFGVLLDHLMMHTHQLPQCPPFPFSLGKKLLQFWKGCNYKNSFEDYPIKNFSILQIKGNDIAGNIPSSSSFGGHWTTECVCVCVSMIWLGIHQLWEV